MQPDSLSRFASERLKDDHDGSARGRRHGHARAESITIRPLREDVPPSSCSRSWRSARCRGPLLLAEVEGRSRPRSARGRRDGREPVLGERGRGLAPARPRSAAARGLGGSPGGGRPRGPRPSPEVKSSSGSTSSRQPMKCFSGSSAVEPKTASRSGGLLGRTALELVEAALGLVGGRAFHVAPRHVPAPPGAALRRRAGCSSSRRRRPGRAATPRAAGRGRARRRSRPGRSGRAPR